MKRLSKTLRSLALAAITMLFGMARVEAYNHPCIPTIQDLDFLKASRNQEPWKSGYAELASASTSQLSWHMEGPFATVSRNPDQNLVYWGDDMTAVWNLARMWYFTGNNAYAQKAHDILLAWANTQTSFGGQESGLALGDAAAAYVGGADILRGTWPGWTDADTTAVKNLFLNVYWPAISAGGFTSGPANKGLINLQAGIAIAAFCDDTAKFNHVIDVYRTYPGSGPTNTLATGEMGETGRDAGHLYAGLLGAAFISEVAWKQGIDLYSELDNRLLACGEYYVRNIFTTDTPFVPFGTVDYTYYVNADGQYGANRAALYLIQNAYKNRFHLPTPWIDRKLQEQPVDSNNWMYARTSDFSTATPPVAIVRPAVSLASSGLTLTTLGGQTSGSSVSYSNGVWTISGLGSGVWTNGADDCQFAYQAMSGDCAMVGKVTSVTYSGSQNGKAGFMIRDNLVGTVSQRGWIGITPTASSGPLVESHMRGWTETWAGSNWAQRSQQLPPGLPYWLKIERRGNMINTYTSQDGTSWAAIESSYYANLPSTVYMGMFVCSGNTTANTATFSNVAFTGGTGGLVTTPAAPAAVLATGSSKAITVRWLPSFGATSYDLLRSTTSGSGYTALASNLSTATTSYVDTTAAANTTYYYVVRAKNSAGTSGNSPQFYGSLLPAPMVNLAFSGTATDSASNASNAENAFDQNPQSQWFYSGTSGWLQYDFGANNAQVVKRYTVSEADTIAARDPKDWTFLGSQDGSNWTTLDSQSGQAFAYWYQQLTYNLSNTNAYRYYRLNVTANNGDSTFLHIGELGLWSDTGHTIPNGTYQFVSRLSNKVMEASGGGTANGTPFDQWGYSGSNSQKWDIADQGNGQYKITGVASGRVMDVAGISTANGATIWLWDWLNGNNQKWTINPAGDGFFRLTAVHSGKVADVKNISTADGAAIQQWVYWAGDGQQWSPSLAIVAASNSLIHEWKFDETAGATAADSVGGAPATLAAGAGWTTGKVNNAVSLNGTSTSYISYPHAFIDTLGDFSITGWFKLNSVNTWARIFDFGTGTTGYMFLVPSNGTGIRYSITNTGGTGEQHIDGTSIPSTGLWHHFAVTLTGNLGVLYVDGVEVGRNSNMTLQPQSLGNTTQNYVGKSQYSGDPYLNGSVDDLRIYNYGLSASEVTALFNNP